MFHKLLDIWSAYVRAPEYVPTFQYFYIQWSRRTKNHVFLKPIPNILFNIPMSLFLTMYFYNVHNL